MLETLGPTPRTTGENKNAMDGQRFLPVGQNKPGRSNLSKRRGTKSSKAKQNKKVQTQKKFRKKQKNNKKPNTNVGKIPQGHSNGTNVWDASLPITYSGNQTKQDKENLEASIFNQIIGPKLGLGTKYIHV